MTDLGRFGHHPDPAIDFCVEVECIEAMVHDQRQTGQCYNDDDTPSSLEGLRRRVERAFDFKVGGDLHAIGAKTTLRSCSETLTRIEETYRSRH